MIKKDLELMYKTLYEDYDRLNDGCLVCEDIDCEECWMVKDNIIKKKQILRLPMFKSVSTVKCKACGKKLHELDSELVVETEKEPMRLILHTHLGCVDHALRSIRKEKLQYCQIVVRAGIEMGRKKIPW